MDVMSSLDLVLDLLQSGVYCYIPGLSKLGYS